MTFVLVVHTLIAIALVATILLQRSEGGALGIGGGPGGLMSARGAGNFLTRATAILAATFLGTSILLAVLASLAKAPAAIDTSLVGEAAPAAPAAPPASPLPAPAGDDLPFALPSPPPPSDEIPTAQ
jgi:preprotein translocase subunit SecG